MSTRDILDKLRNLPPSDPSRRVLEGELSVREKLTLEARHLPVSGSRNYLKPGDDLDPVLQSHLGRKTL